jgi:PAS domain S-box-containing protein
MHQSNQNMDQKLRILFAEDVNSDYELALIALREENLNFDSVLVETRKDFIEQLNIFKPHLVVSDYEMPSFNGTEALALTQQYNPALPFIIFTGSRNENIAVDCMRNGAWDYVLKDNLKRLPFSIKEVLRQAGAMQLEAQAREALAENEKKYRTYIELASDGVFVTDEKGNFLEVNPAGCLMTGYSEEEILKMSIVDFNADLHADQNQRLLDQTKSGGSGIMEMKFRRKDRSVGWWIVNTRKINDNRLIGYTKEITSAKLHQLALIESEKKYKSLIDQMTQGMAVHEIIEDEKGKVIDYRFLDVNNSFESLTGLKKDMILGKTVLEILPDTEPDWIEKYGEVAKTGTSFTIQKFSSQLNRMFEITAYRPQLNQFVAIFTDITERQKSLDALIESESRFRMLFDNTPMGIFYYDKNGIIQSVNEPFVKMLDSSIEKLVGFELEKLKNKEMLNAINLTLAGQNAFFEGLYESVTSGKIGEIVGKFTPVFSIDGKVSGGIGIIDDVSEKKKAERELQESQERFVKSFYSSPAAISIIERKTNKIVEVNDSWCRISGYSRDMVIGKKIDKIIRFEKSSKLLLVNELKTKNSLHEAEINLFSRKNERITALTSIDSYEIAGVEYLLSTMMDITDRKNAEEELVKLTRAVEQSPVSILITDLEGNIEYVNPKTTEVTGYLPFELIGNNPRLLSSGETPSSVYKQMYDVIKAGGIWHGEFHNRTKSGSLIWESASISPVINDEGIMTHYIAIKEDITEWKRMQVILRESEKRYRDMFIGNPLPMYIFELESHKFIEVNSAMTLEYGYNEEEFLSMRLEDIHLKDAISETFPGLLEENQNRQSVGICEHIRKDGSIVNVEISSHPIESDSGKHLRLILEKNITEKLNTEKALQHAKELAEASDKLKTTFLNNISHEVRTPLNGIIGAASLIGDPDLKGQDHEELVEIITTSTERLIQTITDFMDVSLLTSRNMEVFIRKVYLSKLLERVRQKYEKLILEKNLKIELRLPENADSHVLESDEELIFKSLCHLMANAVKFNDRGKVILGYQIKGDQIEFFVEDNGIGISKESQARIFDYFSQEDSSSVRRFEGSGLGLSIVKGISTLLGGSVNLVSTKGLGSCFYFIIPAGKLSHIEPPAPVVIKEKVDQPILLIAEDDESNFFVLEVVVKKTTGAKVIRASNGLEAVDFCRENPGITLVLMDIKMPVMDGLEATREIKAFRPDLPIIAITAYAMSGDEQKALNAGCNDYLAKPVSMKALVAKLEVFGLTKVNK